MRRRVVLGIVVLVATFAAVVMLTRRDRSSDGAAPRADDPTRAETTATAATRTPRAAAEPQPVETVSTRSVRGTVKDADGKSIADADIALLDEWPSGHERRLATTHTAADGTYELAAPGDGSGVVLATRNGFAPQTASRWKGDVVDLVLPAGVARDLLVVDGRGDPVAGAEITLGGDGTRAATVTDERGRARLVAEDKAYVIVRAHGFAFQSAEVSAPADRDDVHRIVLKEDRTISGVVVDGGGKPLANIDVELRGWGDCTSYYADGDRRTEPDGTFSFDGVGSDPTDTPWRLSVCDEQLAAEPVFATPGQSDVRLVARRAAVVRGVVAYPNGKPPSSDAEVGDGGEHVFTGEGGAFELAGVPPGRRTITASALSPEGMNVGWRGAVVVDLPEGGKVEDVHITVAPDAGTSFVFARAVDADGTPLPGADVKAWRDGVEFGGSYQFEPRGLLFVELPPGTPVMLAAKLYTEALHASACTEKPVLTSAAPPTEPIELRLVRQGTLRLHLVDPDGGDVPLDRAAIETESKPRPDGTYPLDADETFKAKVRVPGFADRSVRLAPPQSPLRDETVRLARGTRVVGRVVAAEGRPLPQSLAVSASVENEAENASVADDGRFEIATLPPGRAWLLVKDGDDDIIWRDFDLAAGTPTDLGDLVLPEPATLRFLLVDGGGRPLGGVEASFLDPTGGTVRPATSSRADGTFDVVAPNGFPMRVLLKRRGFATQFVDPVLRGDTPQRVVLGPSGAVRVLASAVRDPGARRVEAGPPDRCWTPRSSDLGGDLVGAEGAVYDDLPPGPVEVALITPRRRLVRTIDVVAGQTIDCVFGE
jgi:hypothetical protein